MAFGERTYWLVNGRIPAALLRTKLPDLADRSIPHLSQYPLQEDLVAVDLQIEDGIISHIYPAGTVQIPPEVETVDVQQGLIWCCFIDMHTHLDKGHSWLRSPNPDGTFQSAIKAVVKDKKYFNSDELYRRMEFGLRCSYALGTQAIRTHIDIFEETYERTLDVFLALKEEWRDRIQLQVVSLVTPDYFLTNKGEKLANRFAELGGVLGAVTYMSDELQPSLDRLFTLAKERQLPLDFHSDESTNPSDISLRIIAETALKHEFELPIVCGHCCSLSVQSLEEVNETISVVKAANIGVVSLPMCNLYLQDRRPDGAMPRLRGVTLLHELKQAGIPVAIASDNCRDAFYAYGNHDGLEVFTQTVRIAHLDRPIGDWCRTITETPAQLLGYDRLGHFYPGMGADLILFKARNFSELLSRPQHDRIVIRGGKKIDATLPDYAELDDIFGGRV